MEKKQTVLKIITIILVISIAVLFVVFYNFKPTNQQNNAKPQSPTNTDTEIEKPNSETPKINYTKLPKKSSNYKENGKIINIGGTNNDKLLKTFVLDNEIIMLAETNSNNNDFCAINKNISICIVDKEINLTKTKILEKTDNLKFVDATIFIDGIILLASDESSTKILLYNEEYDLINHIQIERIDNGKFYHSGLNIKLLSTKNNELSYRMINDSLNITRYTKCNNIGEIYQLFSYPNYDIIITKTENDFEILKIHQNSEIDNTYYLIDKMKHINGLLCNLIVDKDNQNNLIVNYIQDNKITISTINLQDSTTQNYKTEIASNNSYLFPLEYGYILHNYLDNTSNILDNNYNIILSNINMKTDDKTIYSYCYPFCKKYLFQSESSGDNITNISTINKNFETEKILSVPKVNGKIDIKTSNNLVYFFITTNNNIQEFETCYGGYDIFVIMLKI